MAGCARKAGSPSVEREEDESDACLWLGSSACGCPFSLTRCSDSLVDFDITSKAGNLTGRRSSIRASRKETMPRPILSSLLLALVAAAAAAASSGGGGRLHPQGWYLEQFRAWAAQHNVSLPLPEAGRAFRHRLALWADNKCVRASVRICLRCMLACLGVGVGFGQSMWFLGCVLTPPHTTTPNKQTHPQRLYRAAQRQRQRQDCVLHAGAQPLLAPQLPGVQGAGQLVGWCDWSVGVIGWLVGWLVGGLWTGPVRVCVCIYIYIWWCGAIDSPTDRAI